MPSLLDELRTILLRGFERACVEDPSLLAEPAAELAPLGAAPATDRRASKPRKPPPASA